MKRRKLFVLSQCIQHWFLVLRRSLKRRTYDSAGIHRLRFRLHWIIYVLALAIIGYALCHRRPSYIGSSTPVTSTETETRRPIVNVEIYSIFDNEVAHRNNKHLKEFSGEFLDVPPILPPKSSIPQQTIEEIFFVLTTNVKRVFAMIDLLKFWASRPGVNCLIVFEEADFMNHTKVADYLIEKGILCEVQTSDVLRYEQRYFESLHRAWNSQTKEHVQGTIQWFAVGDDDTVWFVDNLLRLLKQYDSSSAIYLGNTSTKKQQLVKHGAFYGFGGAGILLSRPLVLALARRWQQCQRFYYTYGGDEMIGKCITEELQINLTRNHHFHQMDHIGDITGLMESGLNGLATLHHMFKLWRPFPSVHSNQLEETMHRLDIAYRTFGERFLKRYVRVNNDTDQSILITLGYSVSVFHRVLTPTELSQVEKTWCCDEMIDRVTRPKDERKTTWYFQRLTHNASKHEMIYERAVEKTDPYGSIHVILRD